MSGSLPIALGLDFGTESVRAILIDSKGRQLGIASGDYPHGQITDRLPVTSIKLPARYALQSPGDWIDSAVLATRAAIDDAAIDDAGIDDAGIDDAGIDGESIVGIGVDFTSCTTLPTLNDGTPLCQLDRFALVPLVRDAMRLPPGADGVLCLDWMNGCRTPLMDGNLRGAFTGLGLQHDPEHLYLPLFEASGFASIVDAATAMASVPEEKRDVVRPCDERAKAYDAICANYRVLADKLSDSSFLH